MFYRFKLGFHSLRWRWYGEVRRGTFRSSDPDRLSERRYLILHRCPIGNLDIKQGRKEPILQNKPRNSRHTWQRHDKFLSPGYAYLLFFHPSRCPESLVNFSSPADLAQAIMGGVGAVSDPDLGVVVPCNIQNTLATLSFTFGGSGGPTIKVDVSEFVTSVVIPGARPPTFRDNTPACRWGLQPADPDAPILFGDTFLRSAYVVYNLQNEQIGIAQTTFNATKANIVEFSGDDIPGASTTVTGLKVTQTYSGHPLPTVDRTPTGTPRQIGNNGHPTPTFDLGSSKSVGLRTPIPPRIETASLVTAGVVLLSLICGGSMVFLI